MPVGYNEPTALGQESTALVARSVGWTVAGWGSPPAQAREIYIHCRSARDNTTGYGLKLKPGCRSNGNYVNSTPLRVGRAEGKVAVQSAQADSKSHATGRYRIFSELIRDVWGLRQGIR